MYIALGIVLVLVGALIVYFNISYSPTKREFSKASKQFTQQSTGTEGVFAEEDILHLPKPVKNYFHYCGYIGTPKMLFMTTHYEDVDFMMSKNGPEISIDYTTYNMVKKPDRIAYISSRMNGIPFQGFDSYLNGTGGMKGVIGKAITIFNQKGLAMDKACLVTSLSESLLMPNAALQEYIQWEEIDDTHAKAIIKYYDITASGIFTFSEDGEMLSFTTEDRAVTNPDGTMEYVKWSVVCGNYNEENGIKHPTMFQAVWNYDDGDFVYFDGNNIKIEYDK